MCGLELASPTSAGRQPPPLLGKPSIQSPSLSLVLSGTPTRFKPFGLALSLMNTQRPDAYDKKLHAHISDRLDADLREVMEAHGCDRSTAIRAVMRVGMQHRGEIADMVTKDRGDRDRRHREASRIGGRTAMAQRKAKAAQTAIDLQAAFTEADRVE